MDVGDEFYVIVHDQGTGWTRVRHMMTGKEGIVPSAFIDIRPIKT